MRFPWTKPCLHFFVLMVVLSACTPIISTETKPTPKTTPQSLTSGAQEVEGVVVGGGDTTPQGLMDAARTFVFQVSLNSGEEISVQYTAYPPSPVGDAQPKLQLDFWAGEIRKGDYLVTRGAYDPATQMLTVGAEGDF